MKMHFDNFWQMYRFSRGQKFHEPEELKEEPKAEPKAEAKEEPKPKKKRKKKDAE